MNKPTPNMSMAEMLEYMVHMVHDEWAVPKGWWTDLQTGQPANRNVGELLCLVHSEISEALEGFRKNLPDDHLPEFKSIEVELADALIRIFDMAGGLKLRLAEAFVAKMDYNTHRPDHNPEARKGEHGKKF